MISWVIPLLKLFPHVFTSFSHRVGKFLIIFPRLLRFWSFSLHYIISIFRGEMKKFRLFLFSFIFSKLISFYICFRCSSVSTRFYFCSRFYLHRHMVGDAVMMFCDGDDGCCWWFLVLMLNERCCYSVRIIITRSSESEWVKVPEGVITRAYISLGIIFYFGFIFIRAFSVNSHLHLPLYTLPFINLHDVFFFLISQHKHKIRRKMWFIYKNIDQIFFRLNIKLYYFSFSEILFAYSASFGFVLF